MGHPSTIGIVLDRLSVEDFRPALGTTFLLDGTHRLELVDARTVPDAPAHDDAGRRSPFSVIFRGPRDPLLPQRIYRLEHPDLGALELFVVPIGQDADATRYQAVFG
jgi:hypothetical protein